MAHNTLPTVAVINGPNLNWLGRRQPEVYGETSLPALEHSLQSLGDELGLNVRCAQYNGEGEIIDALYALAEDGVRDVIINAGAYTHTSVAIRDALVGIEARVIEVHISNVYAREAFRHHSYLSDIAAGVIAGCGVQGYELALRWFAGSNHEVRGRAQRD